MDKDSHNPYQFDTAESTRTANPLWKQILNWFLTLLVVFLVVVVLPVTFLIGALLGEGWSYSRRAADQRREIQKFAEARRDRYERIEYHQTSTGNTYLTGAVSTEDDL